jgi:hypothetical protein
MATTGSLENQELIPQGKKLSVQRCAGSKSLPNRRKGKENDREDGMSKLSRRPFKSIGSTRTEFLVGIAEDDVSCGYSGGSEFQE